MIPSLIKRILISSALVGGMVLLYLLMYDWKAGVAFAASLAVSCFIVFWWSAVCHVAFGEVPARRLKLTILLGLKILVAVGATIWLRASTPLTRNESLAILSGFPVLLLVTTLKALGALITSRDLMTGKPYPKRRTGPAAGGVQ